MSLPTFVQLAQHPPALPFLLIGGHAVAVHGHVRMTFDVDFLARKSDRMEWIQRAAQAGLRCHAQTDNFAQFSTPDDSDDLDLMLVSDDTFDRIQATRMEVEIGAVRVPVPSLQHLIALKLHAIRHSPDSRMSKDAADIEMLLRRHGIRLKTNDWQQLFLQHGSREILETFQRLLRHE
jgi:hypothetical protein